MADLKSRLTEISAKIEALEEERRIIYEDSHVDELEHPRLSLINEELEHLWDLKRRLEAAISAGLSELPVPPPETFEVGDG
ncbi:MAG: hypothetical protein SNJ69_04005 [Chloroflexaceae bacterium]